MSEPQAKSEGFLHDSDPQLLQAAVAANHREFFVLQSCAGGGQIFQEDDVIWTDPGHDREPMILFPKLDPQRAGQQLDTIVQFYRERRPTQLVGCWSLDPSQPKDLDIRLLARGFQSGWRPCWMWLDLQRLQTNYSTPKALRLDVLATAPTWDAPELPYYDQATAKFDHMGMERNACQIWHFVAWLGGEPVGHSRLCLTRGSLGVAGIYDVGVVPNARSRGIGKAVTVAACQYARALGCRHALLNATGERMYQQLGFERIGYGRTWWLNVARLEARPPSEERIAVAEAVGRGDVTTLTTLVSPSAVELLDESLANGMTLLELAAHAHQPLSAEWLVDHGATLDLLPAWELGWKDRIVYMLNAHPALANQRIGDMQTTPLHVAVERNDLALAQVLLSAHADLSIKDAVFAGTPLDWAKHFQHAEMIELIEWHQAKQSPT